MKHILKVQSLENLPETRPLIAMDSNNNLVQYGESAGPQIEMVDLGLSVKWAKCNLGANTETDYGDYYAWGETTPKSKYTWNTYVYCHGSGSSVRLTKYCNKSKWGASGYTDNLTILESVDDAATQILGENWRMPTIAELNELFDTNKVTNVWVTNYNGSGINGRQVTSLINGNTIFLPAAGYRDGGAISDVGTGCTIWASNLYLDDPRWGTYIYFNSTVFEVDGIERYYGHIIRPVYDPS